MDRFSADLEAFSRDLSDARAKSIRAQIETLQEKYKELRTEAFQNWTRAVLETVAAVGVVGSSTAFPAACIIVWDSAQLFKEGAKQYNEAVDVGKQISRMLSIENSSDKQRERDMDRRG